MTGRLITGTTSALALAVALALAAEAPATAIEVRLTTAEDPVFVNQRADDLYTAALGLELDTRLGSFTFGERMFTDRLGGTRFDETFLSLGRRLPEVAGWHPRVSLGVLRVGHGLLGEGVQNDVHRLMGSDPVELDYAAGDHWYGTAGVVADRVLFERARSLIVLRADLRVAPGFQSSLRVGVVADHRLGPLGLRAGLGLLGNEVESSLLGDHVRPFGLTGELGVAWRRLELRYGFNDYGTKSGHLTISLRFGSGGQSAGGGPAASR